MNWQEWGQGKECNVLRIPTVLEFLAISGFRETLSGQGYTQRKECGLENCCFQEGRDKNPQKGEA